MIKYEIKGLMFHKKTDSKFSFCEFTTAPTSKKAFSNIKFRLKDYNLRDVSIEVVNVMPNESAQLKLVF